MSDLSGPKLREWPFEVLWQEDDSWGEGWASRQFKSLREAEDFFLALGKRTSEGPDSKGKKYRVWLGEIGHAEMDGITREAYFYFKAYRLGDEYASIAVDLGQRGNGLMWFNDEESTDKDGDFVLLKYKPVSESGA